LTEHDDGIKLPLRGTPSLGLALGPTLAKAAPVYESIQYQLGLNHTEEESRNES